MRTFSTTVQVRANKAKCACCNDCRACHLSDKGICETHEKLIAATR